MDREIQDYLRREVDRLSRERVDRGYMDCDPESLTRRANEADELGYTEVGDALRAFRDEVINRLLGEGWPLERIEVAMYNHYRNEKSKDAQ